MCGIFGVISRGENCKVSSIDIYKDLLKLSEIRGREATGFALIDPDKLSIITCKAPVQSEHLIKSEPFKLNFIDKKFHNYFVSIGHTRLAINGCEQNINNNQPVIKDGCVMIHSGIITNVDNLWFKYKQYVRQSDLDTEILPVIIDWYMKKSNSVSVSISKLYDEIEGVANIAFFNNKTDFLTLASNNGSLYYGFDKMNEVFLFASESGYIKKVVKKYNLSIKNSDIKQVGKGSPVFFDYLKLDFVIKPEIKNDSIKKAIREVPFKTKNCYINNSLNHILLTVPDEYCNHYNANNKLIGNLKRCSRCILPETFPYIEFDDKGVCNYCNNYKQYNLKGELKLKDLSDSFKKSSGKPDVLIGLSGGRDSCFALHYVVEVLGLKAIAFSYDWGMLTDLARRNQSRMCDKLGVEHLVVSADIRKKREFIKKNVNAWLKAPNLGTIPLFMAGDKQYFYYANKIMNEHSIDLTIFGENLLETTFFKYGFCKIKPNFDNKETSFSISNKSKLMMILFYVKQYFKNPSYINSSLLDSLGAYLSFYHIPHEYVNLFHYLDWDEETIISTLKESYNWETDPETKSTWRIGDGTAAFYNYIYYIVAGFTENDTFRSNQIREGQISRDKALELIYDENKPRWNSIQWYCNTIGVDFIKTISIINTIPKLYMTNM